MSLKWDDKFSVQIKEIDDQHKKLIDLINALYNAMRKGKGKDVVGAIIKELAEYTIYHFEVEEKYMHSTDYAKKDEHIKEHSNFVEKVNDFYKKFENGSVGLSVHLFQFLQEWLIKHIMVTDKKYVQHFRSNGII